MAAEFIEGGASAGDDRRPVFQQMIERACDGEQAFDLIVVHSYSRFFREAFEQEFYLRKLAKHGVKVVSITQPVGDESEPVQAMMRKVIALFDEYQSKENAKHVIRSMKENARQGFWNGATAPLGYKLVEAEKRGTKIKKKLDIDPVEAETVRLIFKLYLHGDGTSGALGVKEVVKWLNRNGYRTRRGETFGVGSVHKILTNTVYIGRMEVQSDLVTDSPAQAGRGSCHDSRPGHHRAARIRAGSAPASCAQPAGCCAARDDGTDPADGLGGVRHLRRRDDVADRHVPERGHSSLLHLLDLCPQRQERVQGSIDPDGQAGRPCH